MTLGNFDGTCFPSVLSKPLLMSIHAVQRSMATGIGNVDSYGGAFLQR